MWRWRVPASTGNNESGGKRKSGVGCAKAAFGFATPWWKRPTGTARTKDQYFKNLHHRLAGRRGKKRAIVAVSHSLLVTGYYMITRGQDYQDLGANYFDEENKEMVKRPAVKRLEKLSCQVELKLAVPDRA